MPESKKRTKKLPKDVRELDTEAVAQKLFGKRGAKKLRKAVEDNDLEKRRKQ